jgi:hypothetical protein
MVRFFFSAFRDAVGLERILTNCAEYHNKTLTKIFGSPYRGCYFLTLAIFFCGIFRDSLYHQALLDQPQVLLLPKPFDKYVPAVLIGLGQLLVVSSTWALGITGTFLGDYFGILMDERVEGYVFFYPLFLRLFGSVFNAVYLVL